MWEACSVALGTGDRRGRHRHLSAAGTAMNQDWRDFEALSVWATFMWGYPCENDEIHLSQSWSCWHTYAPEGTGRFSRGYTGADRFKDMMSWFLNSSLTFSWSWSARERACGLPFSFSICLSQSPVLLPNRRGQGAYFLPISCMCPKCKNWVTNKGTLWECIFLRMLPKEESKNVWVGDTKRSVNTLFHSGDKVLVRRWAFSSLF